MGVTWTLEIVSSFVTDPPWIWYLTDAANALEGALIFCIFVLKRKVIRKLAHRLAFPNLGPITRPTTTDHSTTFYDPYHKNKTSSTSTLSAASQPADMTECCQGLANNVGPVLDRGYPDFANMQTCELRL